MSNEREKAIYSAWGRVGDAFPCMLVAGEGPLTYRDGTVDPDCQQQFYTICACNFEEASAIYYLRQGWAPYRPMGNSAPCPQCGALYYPEGSGQCWSCCYSC